MTIDERATKYADRAKNRTYFDDRVKDVAANAAYTHYIIGANEQRAIDIEKACETYREELKAVISLFNKLGQRLGCEELGEIISLETSVKEFREKLEQ